jgi:NADP-dependent 3-hydroxy acid dehydrogenase YdfG
MNKLKNKTALITGASSGIGKECAKQLAKKSCNLILVARRKDKLKEIKKEFKKYDVKISIIKLDVSCLKEVQKVCNNILKDNKIDILINNAGLALGLDKIDQGDIEDWERMIDVNIKGLLYISRAIIPSMREENKGHIINISSVAGSISYPNGNVYCATKSAVHSLSESMNIDLYGTDIKVSNVAPGAVETEFSKVRFKENNEKIDATYEGYKPLKAKDIACIITNILNTPKHVNIQNTLIMPTAQRNPYLLFRNK